MVNVKTTYCRCCRCTHIWQKRKVNVIMCPNCKSPYWHVPKGILNIGRPEVKDAVHC